MVLPGSLRGCVASNISATVRVTRCSLYQNRAAGIASPGTAAAQRAATPCAEVRTQPHAQMAALPPPVMPAHGGKGGGAGAMGAVVPGVVALKTQAPAGSLGSSGAVTWPGAGGRGRAIGRRRPCGQ